MKRIVSYALLAMCNLMLIVSCKPKNDKPPYQLDNPNNATISIPYEDIGGVKTIPVKLNGITMNMIYDTGCSPVFRASLLQKLNNPKNQAFAGEMLANLGVPR